MFFFASSWSFELSFLVNDAHDYDDVSCDGSLFQTRATAPENAKPPNADRFSIVASGSWYHIESDRRCRSLRHAVDGIRQPASLESDS